MHKYVMHLRYKLALYQLDGVKPPQQLVTELSLTEFLVQLV
jgi:hypothetical protein